jgi:hypothetical protein
MTAPLWAGTPPEDNAFELRRDPGCEVCAGANHLCAWGARPGTMNVRAEPLT